MITNRKRPNPDYSFSELSPEELAAEPVTPADKRKFRLLKLNAGKLDGADPWNDFHYTLMIYSHAIKSGYKSIDMDHVPNFGDKCYVAGILRRVGVIGTDLCPHCNALVPIAPAWLPTETIDTDRLLSRLDARLTELYTAIEGR